MKTLITILLAISLFGCTKQISCEASKVGSDLIAQQLSIRWSCDRTKLFTFLDTQLQKKFCTLPSPTPLPAGITTTSLDSIFYNFACPTAINIIGQMSINKIVSEFSCNEEKVTNDFVNLPKLCEILKQ